MADIASFRSPLGGQSIGRHALVVGFLKGARRLHPPHPPSVPPWDLEVVLRALSQPPFEPLASVDLKELSIKTTLLLALASAKRIGDSHAFSVDSVCFHFGPGDCSVTLRPRPGYVPKSLSTPLRMQTFFVCPPFWVIDLIGCGRSDSGVPRQGFKDLHWPFGQLSAIWPALRVLWWCERLGRFKTGFSTGLWTLSRLLIRAEVWNAPCTLEPTQQGLSPPPGRGREVCLFGVYALQSAGLLRISSPGFTSWMFSP